MLLPFFGKKKKKKKKEVPPEVSSGSAGPLHALELLDLLQLFRGVFVLLPLPLGQGSELRRPRAG